MSLFSELRLNQARMGRVARIGPTVAFFGNRHCTLDHLQELFPNFKFHTLKQIHSDRVVHCPASAPADGHWTAESNQALTVYTADCVPVLFFNSQKNIVMAIHAGWRGLAHEIIVKGLAQFSQPEETIAFVGPHIRTSSFEVHTDVAEKLAVVGPPGVLYPHTDPTKNYVDLTSIALFQIANSGVPPQKIYTLEDNTFGNPDYYSYRGDPANCGRLISFIARTET